MRINLILESYAAISKSIVSKYCKDFNFADGYAIKFEFALNNLIDKMLLNKCYLKK